MYVNSPLLLSYDRAPSPAAVASAATDKSVRAIPPPPPLPEATRVRVFAVSLCVAVTFVPPTINSATRSRTASLRSTFADPSNA